MTTAAVETPHKPVTLADRVVDACRQAAHLSHEASLDKLLTADAVEDAMYGAQRAVKTARRRWEDVQDKAAHRVKRHPLEVAGLALAVGFASGVAFAWIVARATRCTTKET